MTDKALAEAYHLSRHTIAKWRRRESTEDGSHRPHTPACHSHARPRGGGGAACDPYAAARLITSKIRQSEQRQDLCSVLLQPATAHLHEAEWLLEDPKRMLDFRAELCLASLSLVEAPEWS